MSTSGGSRAVVAALAANLGIAVTKFVAFAFTGSSSMLAEAVHSVADTGNQGLLLLGGRRARKERDSAHPFGYGSERYFYAFIVSLVLFSVGGLFALVEGIDKIRHPHHLDDAVIAVVVLGVAVCLESFSFHTAMTESSKIKGDQSWVSFVRRTKNPELPVVLLEDTAALFGLTFALAGVVLSVVTHNARWDGVGTVAIGALLVTVAIVLSIETKSLLIGEAATPEVQQRIIEALTAGPEVESVIHMRTLHLAPDELLVAAKIAVAHDDTAAQVARGIDAAERRVRAAVSIARVIYLEPDLARAATILGTTTDTTVADAGPTDPATVLPTGPDTDEQGDVS